MSSNGKLCFFRMKFIISLEILPLPSVNGWIVTNFRWTSAESSIGCIFFFSLLYQSKNSFSRVSISRCIGGLNFDMEIATSCVLIFPAISSEVCSINSLCHCKMICRFRSFS